MRASCPFCGSPFEVTPPRAKSTCRMCGNLTEVDVLEPMPVLPVVATPVGAAGTGAVQAPPCARHPRNAAVTGCSRCGDFVCNVCATHVEGTILCVKCFEHKHVHGELYSQKARFNLPMTSLLLGAGAFGVSWIPYLGLMLEIALGPSGIVTGVLAIRAIRRQPALPGEKKAIGGIILSALGVVVSLGVLAWQVWLSKKGGR
jgi:hypothetical protein